MKPMLLIPLLLLISNTVQGQVYGDYVGLVQKHAQQQNLDTNLIWAVMGVESRGNPRALSPKDARGLMQVIPPTAARMGVDPGKLYDPEQNIIAGTRYLRFLSDRFRGNLDHILAGYNAGEGAVDRYKGIPPYRETQQYVRDVRTRYARLSNNPALVTAAEAHQSEAVTEQAPPVNKHDVFATPVSYQGDLKTNVMVF